ncbi:MAG: hypothetical protein JOY71_21550 [Acetobacteraceae bacterium]|nr:hypothetical protein [Acetobacteraceae bacterium]MBV8524671.1 hypothetical protein [Acetobacteraceae bacterium]MBV8590395.1 hypothetical protein [Acetobacteraceae bacterium]
MGSTPFPLGAYFGNPDKSDANAEAQWETTYNQFVHTLSGGRPAVYDNFIDNSNGPSGWVGSAQWSAQSFAATGNNYVGPGSGTTPLIAVPMAPANADWTQNDSFFKRIISGQYDSQYKGIVDAWASAGYKTVQFRPGWEFNGNYMPWGIGNNTGNAQGGPNAPADYVAAFQHIANLIHQQGSADGIDAQVVWNPNGQSWSMPNGQNTADFYPGNQYVDIISLDEYNGLAPFDYTDWASGGKTQDSNIQSWGANPANRQHFWSYPDANQYNPSGTGQGWSLLDTIALAQANGKPISLSETGAGPNEAGISDDPAFPQWEAGVLHQAQSQGVKVQNADIWDSGQFTFTDGSKPQEAAAWDKYFGDPPTGSNSGSSNSSAASALAASTSDPGSAANMSPASPSGETAAAHNQPLPVTDTVAINLSEIAEGGDVQFIASLDGQQLGAAQTVKANHAAGDTETFTFSGNWGSGQHDLKIDLVGQSGAPQGKLYVDSVGYDAWSYSVAAAVDQHKGHDFTIPAMQES